MRRRLMTSIIMALVGAVVAPWFNAFWELPALAAIGVCALGGGIVGYVASMLFDVFTGDVGSVSDLRD